MPASGLAVQPQPCTQTYDETVRHILGPPGQQRLTPAAVWYAHEIAWRPLADTRGRADGAEALACLTSLAASHGYDLDDVLAVGRRPEPSLGLRTAADH